MSEILLTHTDDQGVTTLTLNRPQVHNAFDEALIEQLTSHLQEIAQDAKTRVVVLKANGENFCAGADLKWMARMANYSQQENLLDSQKLAQLMQTLNFLNKPTVALIHGAVYGGGIGLVACCDIAIASNTSIFCFSEVKLGLTPAVISPYVIAAIGERATRRYFLTAERFNAIEAHRLGLVHEIIDGKELAISCEKTIKLLLQNGPQAIAATKHLIAATAHRVIDKALIDFTATQIAKIRVSTEAQERMKVFLKKDK